jgi:hypothetical protein
VLHTGVPRRSRERTADQSADDANAHLGQTTNAVAGDPTGDGAGDQPDDDPREQPHERIVGRALRRLRHALGCLSLRRSAPGLDQRRPGLGQTAPARLAGAVVEAPALLRVQMVEGQSNLLNGHGNSLPRGYDNNTSGRGEEPREGR